MSQELISV